MYNYSIYQEYGRYEVFNDEKKIVMYAKNTSRFFGPEQFVFFNPNHEEIARYKCSLFLSFGYNHRIIFNDSDVCYIRSKLNGLFFNYKGIKYSLKFKRKGDELFENEKPIGHIKAVQNESSKSEHYVYCSNKEACIIFSMIDIALNNFNVN